MNENHYLQYSGIGLPDDIQHLKDAGYFKEAERLLDLRLLENLPECIRQNYLVQKEILHRLPFDYTYTKEEALLEVQKQIPDFTMEELQHHIDIGRITWHFVDGEMKIIHSFFDNMVKEGYFDGRLPKKEEAKEENHEIANRFKRLEDCARKMMEKGSLDARITMKHSIHLKDEAFIPGETYRIYIPIAAQCLQQSDIKLEKTSCEPTFVSPEDAKQRTVFWETKLDENRTFEIEYSYLYHAPYVNPLEIKASELQPTFDTEEIEPNISFSPLIKALCKELSEGTNDPIEKAHRFYNYITTQCKYSFMPNYFCLDKIAEGCLMNRRGDCGVLALAFVTLCRCAGIPAKWQSGLVADPYSGAGCHDWAMFYVEPFGWMFADCSFGGAGYRQGSELRHKFYFGNLDIYRCVTVNSYQSDLQPEEKFFRYDPYDNQIGEISCSQKSFIRKDFDYDIQVSNFEIL